MSYILKQKTKSGRIQINLASSVYRPGNTPGQDRTYLGILENEASNELLKNRKLKKIPPEAISLLKEYNIVYKGKLAPRPGRVPKPKHITMDACTTLEVGRVEVLQRMATESGLSRVLKNAFGEEVGREVLAVSTYLCCEGKALYLAGDWASDTILGEQKLSLSSSTLSKLCSDLGANESARNDFFRHWIKQNKYPRALVHDTTSISRYSEKISAVEWGYNRDREQLPQVNFGLVYARKTQLPLFYRLIPGSVTDVVTLTTTSAMLRELGLTSFSYSLDRGYYSTANLLDLIKNKLDFNIGFPIDRGGRELLNGHRRELDSAKSLIGGKDFAIHHVETEHIIYGSDRRNKHTLYAHIYRSENERARLTTELNVLLNDIIRSFDSKHFSSLSSAEKWCEENLKGHEGLLQLTGRTAGHLKLEIAEKKFAEIARDLGTFMILTSQKTDGIEALLVNKKRDSAEKIFDTLKNSVGDGRLHGCSDENISGRLFLAFVATILHSLLEKRLRDKQLLTTKFTVLETLSMLKKIKVTVCKDGTRIPNEIPKRVQDLLAELDIELKQM